MLALRYHHDMSEEPMSDDVMPRPGWRYITWHGWNLLALGWIGIELTEECSLEHTQRSGSTTGVKACRPNWYHPDRLT
jgi:hypothetical protein